MREKPGQVGTWSIPSRDVCHGPRDGCLLLVECLTATSRSAERPIESWRQAHRQRVYGIPEISPVLGCPGVRLKNKFRIPPTPALYQKLINLGDGQGELLA